MPLLYRLRQHQPVAAKAVLALFMSVWLALALQPCAMAVQLAEQEAIQASAIQVVFQTVPDHCGEAATQHAVEAKADCPQCVFHAADDPCQADEWTDSKQTLQATIDTTTDEATRLVVLISLQQLRPAYLGQHYRHTLSLYVNGITATSLHDVSRC